MLKYIKRILGGSAVIDKPENTAIYGRKINKPIFIVGCGRSGTTLLFDLFKRHPDLVGTTGYPDGEDHEGWIEHGECIISGLGALSNINGGHTGFHYCLYMDDKDVTPAIIKKMTAHYNRNVLKKDTSKRVVNKCPHLSNKLRYVQAIFPDAKFIHIIRECLPVVSSWIKIMEENQPHQVLYLPETEFPCFWVFPAPAEHSRAEIFKNETRIFPGKGVAILADYWSKINRNIPLQLSAIPEQLITVKYEELCNDPLQTLHRICDFCDIRHFEGIPIKINKNFNQKYKSCLSSKQIDEFLRRSDETRSFFGY